MDPAVTLIPKNHQRIAVHTPTAGGYPTAFIYKNFERNTLFIKVIYFDHEANQETEKCMGPFPMYCIEVLAEVFKTVLDQKGNNPHV